jgi:peptidoglycan/xylan/chitin deacetylase (PgdA/CDA1 family)
VSEVNLFQRDLLPRHYHRLSGFGGYFQTGTPILAYHAIQRPPAGTKFRGLFYPREHLAAQLNELAQAGYTAVQPVESLQEHRAKTIVLTFDDGYQSLMPSALPELVKHRFVGLAYLVTDCIGKTNSWDIKEGVAQVPLMNISEIREWLAAGQRIGSHTLTHPRLGQIDRKQAKEEITASRKKLEDMFGVVVEDFCYPYGDWNPAVRDLVMETGYKTATTLNYGLNSPGINPGELLRLTVRKPNRSWKTLKTWMKRQWWEYSHRTS